MATGCGDVLSLADLQTAKKHQTFEAEVITGKQGGVASGADIDFATNQVTGQTQKTLPAILRDAGFRPAAFNFTNGGTLSVTDTDKVVYDPVSKAWYSWAGSLPKVIAAGTNPLLDANWRPQTDPKLRDDLAGVAGYTFIPSVNRINSVVPVEQFRDGTRTDQEIVQAANDYAKLNGYDLLFEAGRTYTVATVSATCTWRGKGTIKRTAGTTQDLLLIKDGGSAKGIQVDGSADTLTTSPNTVLVNSVSRFDLSDLFVYNSPGQGISVINSPVGFAPSRVMRCRVEGGSTAGASASKGSGVYLFNALNVDVIDCEVTKKNVGILGQGDKRNFANITASGNRAYNNYGGGVAFVLMTEASDQQAYEKVIITKNHIFGNGDTGLSVQCDRAVVTNNNVYNNGSQIYHQGILVNANDVMVSNNTITGNAGVGIDFGDCRKCAAVSNVIEENGWIGIEVNSCEQQTVIGNVLNLNFKGKSGGDLQAGILVHKGDGGYPFAGDSFSVTVVGNTVRGGDGQSYAILIGTNCREVVVSSNTCKNAGILDDIVCRSSEVITEDNVTRWDPLGSARATIASGGIDVPSVAKTVSVNGTGSVIIVSIADGGAFVKDRVLRLVAVNGFTLENSGGVGGNLFLKTPRVIAAGDSFSLWSDGSGGWKPAYS